MTQSLTLKVLIAAGALGSLAGCADTGATTDAPETPIEQTEIMADPCLEQAARLTGVPLAEITVTGSLETGGGPLLTLSAGGTPLSCRQEADGGVTVFSEYAN